MEQAFIARLPSGSHYRGHKTMSKGSSGPRHSKRGQQGNRIKSFGLINQSSNFFTHIRGSMSGEELMKEMQTSVSYQQGSMEDDVLGFDNMKVGGSHQVRSKLNQTGYHNILQYHVTLSGTWLAVQIFLWYNGRGISFYIACLSV